MGSPESNLPPGFRFHPTDEELILHYLRKKVASIPLPVSIIAEVDIYKLDPWELPGKAAFGEKEWYFFSPRDRKYPNGARPNRAAASGYWKATGTDKTIMASIPGSSVAQDNNIGVKKALVFYKGRPPKGVKTNWIMHEYRLVDNNRPIKLKDTSMRLDDWVLCRIYKKSKFTVSPVGDQDQTEENLFIKDTLLPISKSSIPTQTPQQRQQQQQQHNTLISQKSVSFSNLLDAMDYSMLSNFLSENQNHHSNNNNNHPQGMVGIGSSSNLGFNIGGGGNMDQQQQSQINTNTNNNNISNSYMFQRNNNNTTSLNNNSSVTNYNNMENNIMMMRPKRQLLTNIDEDEETLLHPSKKYLMSSSSSCSFSNNSTNNTHQQFENPSQWNYLMKQSLLNQQLLLGPHLRFQG